MVLNTVHRNQTQNTSCRGKRKSLGNFDHGNKQHVQTQVIKGEQFITPGYLCKRFCGRGAYGAVCTAIHLATKKKTAIKKVKEAFDKSYSNALFALRELKMLEFFDHPSIVGLQEAFVSNTDLYIVMDRMECDLSTVIRSEQLGDDQSKYIMRQLLCAIDYMHSAQVMHRDIKPGNVLVNRDCKIKLCDFGMACSVLTEQPLELYVVTRWYRAPEILCEVEDYGVEVDMWAVGCVFAEMLLGETLWPGKHQMDQLNLILSDLGRPNDVSILPPNITFPPTQRGGSEDFCHELLCDHPSGSPEAIELVSSLLQFDWNDRASAREALELPYTRQYRRSFPVKESAEIFPFEYEQNMERMEDFLKEACHVGQMTNFVPYKRRKTSNETPL